MEGDDRHVNRPAGMARSQLHIARVPIRGFLMPMQTRKPPNSAMPPKIVRLVMCTALLIAGLDLPAAVTHNKLPSKSRNSPSAIAPQRTSQWVARGAAGGAGRTCGAGGA